MSRLETIGIVTPAESDAPVMPPRGGISFRLNYLHLPASFDIALTCKEMDSLVYAVTDRSLGRTCLAYDFEVAFPEPKNNLFVASREATPRYAEEVDVVIRFTGKDSSNPHSGELAAHRTYSGWTSLGYSVT